MKDSTLKYIEIFIMPILIVALTFFSGLITQKITKQVNQEKEKQLYIEQVSEAISDYIFSLENFLHFYEKGWTDKKSLFFVANEYNLAITNIRKKELTWQFAIEAHWAKESMQAYNSFLPKIKDIDNEIHKLNEFVIPVINDKKKKVDPSNAAPIISSIRPKETEMKKIAHEIIQLMRAN